MIKKAQSDHQPREQTAISFGPDLLEKLKVSVILVDNDGVVLYVNRTAAFLLSVSPEAMVGTPIGSYLGDQESDLLDAIEFGAVVEELEGSLVFESTNGESLPLGYSMDTYIEADERRGYLLRLHDLTLVRQNETQNRLHELALDSVANMIMITDEQGHIQYVNQEYLKVTGFDHVELLGSRAFYLEKDERNEASLLETLERTIHAGRVWEGILKNVTKEGQEYYEEMTITPLIEEGRTSFYVAVSKDISQRVEEKRQLSEAKEAAERALIEAENANKSKDIFLSNMSHELRTPLNAIIGFSQVLKSKSTDEMSKPYLEKINISGNTLLNLVNTILDFSKIESGKMDFHPEPVPLAQLFDEVGVLVEAMAGKKGIAIKTAVMEEVMLQADRQLLKQLFVNLLSNAVKFSPDDSQIEISLSEESDHITLGVHDHGMGISEEAQKTLFDPFVQVREHQKSALKGSGLGLSISKNIVKMHQGEIRVESVEGEGSSFYVRLPRHAESESDTAG
jgi:PAS domain S-box-containing protein